MNEWNCKNLFVIQLFYNKSGEEPIEYEYGRRYMYPG